MPISADAPPQAPQLRIEAPGDAVPTVSGAAAQKMRATFDPNSIPLAQRAEYMKATGYSDAEIRAATQPPQSQATSIQGKLAKLVASQAANRPLTAKVANLKVGELSGLAFAVNLEWISNDNPRVAQDPDRMAYNQSAASPPVWLAAGGAVLPKLGAAATLGGVKFGFSADAQLSYSIIRPYQAELSEAKRLASNASVDLPLTLAEMRATEPGTELVIIGRGRIAGSVGVEAGRTLASGRGYSVGASASATVGDSKEETILLRFKHRANGEVYAQLSTVETDKLSAELRAFVGVDSRLAELLPDAAGIGGAVLDRAAAAVDKKIESIAKVEASLVLSSTDLASDRGAFAFTTGGKDAEAAFAALFRLDPGMASADDARFAGVRRARLESTAQVGELRIGANAGPLQIINAGRRLATDKATFTRVDAEGNKSEVHYRSVDLDRDYSGMFSNNFFGARRAQRSLISLEENGVTKNYYHLRYTVDRDGHTSGGDLRSMVVLAETFGAVDPEVRAQIKDPKVREQFRGTTSRVVEISIDDAGLKDVVDASSEARLQAHAAMFARDQGIAVAPWMNTGLKDYSYWLAAIDQGPQVRQEMGYRDDASEFWRLTGIDLRVAHEAFHEGRNFDRLIATLQGKDPAVQQQLLKKSAYQFKISPFGTLGTAAYVAGPEHVLVHEMSVTNAQGQKVSLKSEGAPVDPRAALARALENP